MCFVLTLASFLVARKANSLFVPPRGGVLCRCLATCHANAGSLTVFDRNYSSTDVLLYFVVLSADELSFRVCLQQYIGMKNVPVMHTVRVLDK